MKPQDYPIEHFQLMVNIASALAGFSAQILQQHYHYESFGSWWFSFRFKGQELRVVFDGKDGSLSLQKKLLLTGTKFYRDKPDNPMQPMC